MFGWIATLPYGADLGTLSEAAGLSAASSAVESATLADSASLGAVLTSPDSGTLSDASAVAAALAAAESILLGESAAKAIAIAGTVAVVVAPSSPYEVGDQVTFQASFAPSAPYRVRLQLARPDGTTVEYEYGDLDALIAKASAVYTASVSLGQAGHWGYRWIGEGGIVAAGESELYVRNRLVRV